MHRAEPSAGPIRITGTGDQLPPESVITFHRIAWSASTGIRDHVRPERASYSSLPRGMTGRRTALRGVLSPPP